MKIFLKIAASILVLLPSLVLAEVVVIVHPSNAVGSMSSEQVSQLFLGKVGTFAGGGSAIVIDQKEGLAVRDSFYGKVANKNAAQMNAYWSQLIFTGKGQPPKAVADGIEVLELVADNPNLIGYIDASEVDDTVKVVASFP